MRVRLEWKLVDMWRVPLPEEEIVDYSTRPYNINIDTGHKYLTPGYFKK